MRTKLLYAVASTAVVTALAGAGIAATGASASVPARDHADGQRPAVADERSAVADRDRPAGLAPDQLQVDFAGTVALSNCSGSLIRFTTSEPTDPAMALTNGHCYEGGFMEPGEVHVDEPSNRSMTLLNASGSSAGTLQASSIAYGTMTDTDVLLYELDQTYAEIEQATGVPALTLATEEPPVAADISVVSGFWQEIYTCAVDGYVYLLHEADWTWKGSTRYTQPGCEVIGGTSGSPVIRHDTGEVAAINNTTNENGEQCTLNNPCEETETGEIIYEQGRSYAQQTVVFYTCLTAEREIDLTLEGCLLPDPA
jgi:V8-like Glu-specific endopeptidase